METVPTSSSLTPINHAQLQLELALHQDIQFTNYLINGLRYGFNPLIHPLPTTSIECNNNYTARKDQAAVSLLVKSEVTKDYVAGPFSTVPYAVYRVSPLGLAIGKYSQKKRLILDLSAPHDKPEILSINELFDKDQCSLSYVTIDYAIAIIANQGRGAKLCKLDISDAFKQVPIANAFIPFFGFKWQQQYYFYKRLVFGCRSSPKLFDTLSEDLCWILHHNYGIQHILHLLDDFLTIDSPEADAQQTMTNLPKLFQEMCIPIAEHKTMGPATTLEYLGINLDTNTMTASLPQDKLDRISALLHEFSQKKKCTKRELLSLLGHLSYACKVIIPGRSFISHLLDIAKSVKKLHHQRLQRANKISTCGISFYNSGMACPYSMMLTLPPIRTWTCLPMPLLRSDSADTFKERGSQRSGQTTYSQN
ncbi:uncharacterized protein LOC125384163 [Haliotis rufescens]|uniref:uncharacterized protein LOC125384163 n=1 Tax=Haliotis rufescens TaxID=6454 RepID=UPI00201EFF2A|nr:uncharacterized protein LOC125384163 [Haliotis rufescens]XP_048258605.1 uncharacterized protein LOC125384163 [Haliotis rufescens]